MKIKILIAHHYFPKYRVGFLKKIVEDERYEVTLLFGMTTGRKEQAILSVEDLERAGYKPERLLVAKNTWLLGGLFMWQSLIISKVWKENYDAVVILGDYKILSYWGVLLVSKFKGLKVLLWTHGLKKPKSGISWLFQKLFYRCSAGLLLYGNKAVEHLEISGLGKMPLYFFGNSLDYDQQKSLRHRCKGTVGRHQLLCVGRLIPAKKVHILLQAIKLVPNLSIELVIIGGGSSEKELKAQAIADGLTNVKFVGEVYDEIAIAKYMNRAELVVIPGDAGLPILHALGYGIPIITHDNINLHGPEIEAAIGASACTFYKFDDASDLALKIEKVICSNDSCFSRCVELVESSYTPQAQVDRLFSVLRGGGR